VGRGLRKEPGKEFLVILDFVGNFRKAHVAPLALAGYTSVENFAVQFVKLGRPGTRSMLPRGCFLSPDLEAQRIWDDEIRAIIEGRLSPEERLRILYNEIREALAGRSPCLTDFFASGLDVDPTVFIRFFGNWLRTKLACEETLPPFEEGLLDTRGEEFLQHLERELSPVRSYKMVVLSVILDLPGGEWRIEDIARGFHSFFLEHREWIQDYDELARSDDPVRFPLGKVIVKLKQMPLRFLSNTERDFFVLDRAGGWFRLKQDVLPFWQDPRFRDQVRDRVRFVLLKYFNKKMEHDL
jgi:hypothetical protein